MVKEIRGNGRSSTGGAAPAAALTSAKSDFNSPLEAALFKKRELEREILTLERQIFALETSYLENTAQIGDLVRGWTDVSSAISAAGSTPQLGPGASGGGSGGQGSVAPGALSGAGGATSADGSSGAGGRRSGAGGAAGVIGMGQLKKRKVLDTERLFTQSSATAQRNPEFFAQAGGRLDVADGDDYIMSGRPSKQSKLNKKRAARGGRRNQPRDTIAMYNSGESFEELDDDDDNF
jgi:hypothetical protein